MIYTERLFKQVVFHVFSSSSCLGFLDFLIRPLFYNASAMIH